MWGGGRVVAPMAWIRTVVGVPVGGMTTISRIQLGLGFRRRLRRRMGGKWMRGRRKRWGRRGER